MPISCRPDLSLVITVWKTRARSSNGTKDGACLDSTYDMEGNRTRRIHRIAACAILTFLLPWGQAQCDFTLHLHLLTSMISLRCILVLMQVLICEEELRNRIDGEELT